MTKRPSCIFVDEFYHLLFVLLRTCIQAHRQNKYTNTRIRVRAYMPSDEHFLLFHFIIFVMNLSDFNVLCSHVWWAEHVTQNVFFFIWNVYLGNGKSTNVSELKMPMNEAWKLNIVLYAILNATCTVNIYDVFQFDNFTFRRKKERKREREREK